MTYAQALVNAMEVVADEETRARLADLKASLEKKASSKKAKVDNSEFEQKVLDVLAEGSKTPTELVGLIGVANTQKVASVCKPLIESGSVLKITKGKKVSYALA